MQDDLEIPTVIDVDLCWKYTKLKMEKLSNILKY